MIPPDQEIYEVEKRIAERRHRVEAAARSSARQALRALTSPWALAGAAVIGFLAAGGVQRHRRPVRIVERRRSKTETKAGTVASIAMAAASWIIKSQFGSPVGLAQFVLAKLRKAPAPPAPWTPSSRPDRIPATTRR